MRQHQHPNNSSPAQTLAVYLHYLETGHTFNTDDVVILDREEYWARRGIKEAVWEKVESPLLTGRESYGMTFRPPGTGPSANFLVACHVTKLAPCPHTLVKIREPMKCLRIFNSQTLPKHGEHVYFFYKTIISCLNNKNDDIRTVCV